MTALPASLLKMQLQYAFNSTAARALFAQSWNVEAFEYLDQKVNKYRINNLVCEMRLTNNYAIRWAFNMRHLAGCGVVFIDSKV